MSKFKTKKSVSKRFKVTATGKILFGHQMRRHLRRKMRGSALRRKKIPGELKGAFKKKIKRLLGGKR